MSKIDTTQDPKGLDARPTTGFELIRGIRSREIDRIEEKYKDARDAYNSVISLIDSISADFNKVLDRHREEDGQYRWGFSLQEAYVRHEERLAKVCDAFDLEYGDRYAEYEAALEAATAKAKALFEVII